MRHRVIKKGSDDDEEAVGDCADVTADADRDARVFCTRTLWSQERERGAESVAGSLKRVPGHGAASGLLVGVPWRLVKSWNA